jgi:hypothetical protein
MLIKFYGSFQQTAHDQNLSGMPECPDLLSVYDMRLPGGAM